MFGGLFCVNLGIDELQIDRFSMEIDWSLPLPIKKHLDEINLSYNQETAEERYHSIASIPSNMISFLYIPDTNVHEEEKHEFPSEEKLDNMLVDLQDTFNVGIYDDAPIDIYDGDPEFAKKEERSFVMPTLIHTINQTYVSS